MQASQTRYTPKLGLIFYPESSERDILYLSSLLAKVALKMMQEILLFGQVSADNHQIFRQQLAGLARMQPQPVLERHLIFKPRPPSGLANLPSGSGPQGAQQQELQKTRQMLNSPLSYVQLVGSLENKKPTQKKERAVVSDMNEDHAIIISDDEEGSREGRKTFQWYLEFKDIPEPGKVSAASRAFSRTRFLEGDFIKFMNDLGYE